MCGLRACPQKYGPDFRVVSLDAGAKVARLACGTEVAYDALVSTQPLDATLTNLGQTAWADTLSHRRAANSTPHTSIVVGVLRLLPHTFHSLGRPTVVPLRTACCSC